MTETEKQQLFNVHAKSVALIARSVARRRPRRGGFCVEDFAQIGYVALLKLIDEQYDPAREATFASLVQWRVRGAILDASKRRHYAEATRPSLEAAPEPVSSGNGEAALIHKIDIARAWETLQDRITALPDPRARRIMELRYSDGLSQRGAGKLLGISQPTVAKIEAAALQALREAIMSAARRRQPRQPSPPPDKAA